MFEILRLYKTGVITREEAEKRIYAMLDWTAQDELDHPEWFDDDLEILPKYTIFGLIARILDT